MTGSPFSGQSALVLRCARVFLHEHRSVFRAPLGSGACVQREAPAWCKYENLMSALGCPPSFGRELDQVMMGDSQMTDLVNKAGGYKAHVGLHLEVRILGLLDRVIAAVCALVWRSNLSA